MTFLDTCFRNLLSDSVALDDPLSRAIAIATVGHLGQRDKGGIEPYILHPLRVMAACPHNVDLRCVAVMHDVLEDTRITLVDLAPYFNHWVLNALEAITRRNGPGGKEVYRSYIERVAGNRHAKYVKRADIADNLDPIRMAGAFGEVEMVALKKRYGEALKVLSGDASI